MSIDRWVDLDVVHIYNGILSNHKKVGNWVICRDMGGPRVCHREWNKLERIKQISYINTYMWNLEKRYRWTYLQGRNRDAVIENEPVDTGGGRRDELGNGNWRMCTASCKTESWGKPLYSVGSSAWGRWRVGGPRGRACVYTYSWCTSLYSRN